MIEDRLTETEKRDLVDAIKALPADMDALHRAKQISWLRMAAQVSHDRGA